MKWTIAFTILFFPELGFGQTQGLRKFESIGLVFSPSISYRTLNYSSSNQWVARLRDNEELPSFGFMAGATIHYRLTSRIKIETGILYSDMGIKTKFKDLTWVTADEDFPLRTKTVFHHGSIRVPIKVNYQLFEHNKLKLYAVMGLSTNLFINKSTKVVTEYSDGHASSHTSSKHAGYSIFNVGLIVGTGVEYELSKRVYSRLEPNLIYSITSASVDKESNEYFYSLGINAGIFYRFGNKAVKH